MWVHHSTRDVCGGFEGYSYIHNTCTPHIPQCETQSGLILLTFWTHVLHAYTSLRCLDANVDKAMRYAMY